MMANNPSKWYVPQRDSPSCPANLPPFSTEGSPAATPSFWKPRKTKTLTEDNIMRAARHWSQSLWAKLRLRLHPEPARPRSFSKQRANDSSTITSTQHLTTRDNASWNLVREQEVGDSSRSSGTARPDHSVQWLTLYFRLLVSSAHHRGCSRMRPRAHARSPERSRRFWGFSRSYFLSSVFSP